MPPGPPPSLPPQPYLYPCHLLTFKNSMQLFQDPSLQHYDVKQTQYYSVNIYTNEVKQTRNIA